MNAIIPSPPRTQHELKVFSYASKLDLYKVTLTFKDAIFMRYDKETLKMILHPETTNTSKYVYIFTYGSVVFVDFDAPEQTSVLEKIKTCFQQHYYDPRPAPFTQDHFSLKLDPLNVGVQFSCVTIPAWNDPLVAMISNAFAHSACLMLLERQVSEALKNSENSTNKLKALSFRPLRRKALLHQLVNLLEIRHRIVNQLSLLKEPKLAWTNELAELIYSGLMENFSLRDRVETLEKHLSLIGEVSELQLDLFNTQKSEWLEIIIILLILIEILQTMFHV